MAAGGGQFARSAQLYRRKTAQPGRPRAVGDGPAVDQCQLRRCAAGVLVLLIAQGPSV
jgi:hypothetical protein